MSDRPCMLNPEKWRVRQYLVPHEHEHYGKVRIRLYGVWPPTWDIDGPPILMYPMHHQAFRAAWDRAQFAAVPPPQAQRPANVLEAASNKWRDIWNGEA